MQMPGRQYSNGSSYRYGFGGKEKSDEISGEGNAYDFDARMYNPRIGRWFSTDAHPKAFSSPYNYVQNNPVNRVDPDGNDDIHFYFVTNSVTKTYGIGVNQRSATYVTHSSFVYVEKNNRPDKFYQHNISGGSERVKQFYPFDEGSRSGLTQSSMPFSCGLINRNDRDVHTLSKYYDASPQFKSYLDKRRSAPGFQYTENGRNYNNTFDPNRKNFNFWGKVSSTAETAADLLMLGRAAISIVAGGESSQTIYRAFGDEAKPFGKSWTPINPASVNNYREAAGLPNVNSGRFLIEGTVKESNILLKRSALEADGNAGGIMEYIIKNPSKIKVTKVSGVNPKF